MTIAISNKAIRIFLTALVIVAAVYPLFSKNTFGAEHTVEKDTLTRLATSAAANHTIQLDLASAWDASEDLVINFDDGFDTTGFATTEPEDFDIRWDDAAADKTIVAAGSCAANSIEVNAVNTTTDTFTFRLCSGSTASGANESLIIRIGTNATIGASGDDQIDNPGSSGSKTVFLTGPTSGDDGSFAIPIMSSDQVTVSATVDPTITSSLSSTTCSLGTLSTGSVSGCTYTNAIATNALNGYAATLVENNNLRIDVSNDINDSAGGAVNAGSEEYGFASSDTSSTPDAGDYDGACGGGASEAAEPIDGTETYANQATVASDTITLCHAASITGTTTSGVYSHIVTHITTGTF
jgi:hypothetical protein